MKIKDLKVVFICPDHNEKYTTRRHHMEQLLKNIGFTQIEHYKSSTENYPDCLNKANMEILKNNLDNPILILEDDVEWTGLLEFDFNKNCDAIYLGLSISAGHPTDNSHLGDYQVTNISDSQVRVLNMLGGHAILYISRQYKEAVIDTLTSHLGTQYHIDVLFSRLQPKFFVLANKIPAFYQSAKFNKSDWEEKCTNFIIDI